MTWPSLAGSRSAGLPNALIRFALIAGWCLLFVIIFAGSLEFVTRFGIQALAVVLGTMLAVAALGYLSIRDLSYAVAIWLFVMSGFRTVGMVHMPGLPDVSNDRLLLVWVVTFFVLQILMKRAPIKGPFLPDWLLIVHTVYILVQLHVLGVSVHMHEWVASNLSPLFGYFFGKYVIREAKHIRTLMLFLWLITVYYYVVSIAQRFDVHALIWPKTILDRSVGLFHEGRSRGPVLHPPLFGQLLGMFMLIHFCLLSRPFSKLVKAVLSASLAASLVGLLFTFTRGPWVATAAGLVTLAFLRPIYRRLIVIVTILSVVAGALGALRVADTKFLEERVENVDTIENRLGFLAAAAHMARDYPVFGIGYFRYKEYRDRYNQGVYIPLYGYVKKKQGAEAPIHDIYIGRTAEEGFVGAFLLIAFFLQVFRAWIKRWRNGPFDDWFNRNLLAFFAAVMVTYTLGGMVIDYRYFDLVNVVFYMFAGIIIGYPTDQQSDEATTDVNLPVRYTTSA